MRIAQPIAALTLAAALLAAACSSDPWNDPAIGDPYVPDPRTARRVGRLLEDASPRVVAANGGASVATSARTLWLLEDVRIGFGSTARTSPSAVLSTLRGDWPGSDGANVELLSADAGNGIPDGHQRRWLAGIRDGDDALLHYAVTRPGPEGEPSLDYLGCGVARLSLGGLRIAEPDGDWRFFDRGDPVFGMAVVQAGHGVTTGFDYIYGIRGDAGTQRVYVARVPHGQGDFRDQYRFWTGGPDWSDDVADAEPLFRAGPQGLSVSWNEHLQAFLAVYAWVVPGTQGQPDRVRVLARAARAPEGPWSRETPLCEMRGPVAPGRVRPDAGAREHPALAQGRGRVLFVSVDGGGAESNVPEPAPRMWRVEFPDVR